jgi:hypothetical protein
VTTLAPARLARHLWQAPAAALAWTMAAVGMALVAVGCLLMAMAACLMPEGGHDRWEEREDG